MPCDCDLSALSSADRRPGSAFRTRLFWTAAAVLLGLCVWGGAFGPPGAHAWRFIGLFLLTGLVGLSLIVLLPASWTQRRQAVTVLAVALACRLALLPHPVSDDVNRYVWEGRVLAAGRNPYVVPPADPQLAGLRDAAIWPGINHKDQTACYPPLMTAIFAGLARLGGEVPPIKLFVVLADLAAVACLLQLLRERRESLRWAFLYATNPVILYSFAGQAHLDAVHVALLATAILLHGRQHYRLMFLCLGLAVQAKYVALLAAPFLVSRTNIRRAWIGVLAAGLPLLPFLAWDGAAVFQSLTHFGTRMAFNGSIHGLLRVLFGEIEAATLLCGGLFLAAALWALVRLGPRHWRGEAADPVIPLLVVFGALLVCAPTVHFWYLSWILPLVVLRPSASWTVLSLSIAFYFIAPGYDHYGLGWTLPVWSTLAIWLPFGIVFVPELLRGRQRMRAAHARPAPASLSVIIPTHNEADRIEPCIRAVQQNRGVAECIVVDGCSEDQTVQRAQALGACVVEHAAPVAGGGGRGGQIGTGLRRARGDVVAVVHADTCVAPDAFARVLEALRSHPDAVGGAIGSRFVADGLLVRILELANDLRAGFLGVAFGDQVQFFRRAPVVEAGLYPELPLMEDVELSFRLQRLGRVVYLWGDCRVSARRWQQGAAAHLGRVLALCSTYCLTRLWRTPDTVDMYSRYYKHEGRLVSRT